MERFFVYSKEHNKPIRLLVQMNPGEKMQYLTCIVLTWDAEKVFYIRARKCDQGKPPREIPLSQIFSADYARGDHGDTLQFQEESKP